MNRTQKIDFSARTIERAEAIFERFLGYRLSSKEYTETIRLSNVGFLLTHSPFVSLVSVYGKTSNSGIYDYSKYFGSTDWTEISIQDVVIHEKNEKFSISLPPSVFGTSYEEAKITYLSGLETIPNDVEKAVLEIARLLEKGEIDEWHCFLPIDVLDVIEKYRKGES